MTNSRQCDNPGAEHPGFPCNHIDLSDPAPPEWPFDPDPAFEQYDDPTGGIGADDLPRVPESEDPWAMLEREAAEAATPQPEPRPLDFDSPVTIELHLVTGEIRATTIPPTWYSARSDLFYTNLDLLVWTAMADGIPAAEVRIVPAALPATDTDADTPENGNPS